MSSPFLLIGHRGAAGLAPEHTRASFERALASGVDMVELDVQLSRDGQLVVIHDHTLDRTTSRSGPVRDHTLAELQQLDTGGWFGDAFRGEPMLTLAGVFELLGGRATLNVEIKSPEPDWEPTARVLAAVLRQADPLGATVVSSFEMGALAAVRRMLPAVHLGVLWQFLDLAGAWEWAARLGATSVHPFYGLTTEEGVRAAHARGLHVYVWTVNEEEEIRRMAAAGVDGIISDFPDRLRSVSEQLGLVRTGGSRA